MSKKKEYPSAVKLKEARKELKKKKVHWSELPPNLFPPQREPDLRDEGLEVTNPISKEEAMDRGWLLPDTKSTRLARLGDEIIEIDWRKRVNAKGNGIVWCWGEHPKSLTKGPPGKQGKDHVYLGEADPYKHIANGGKIKRDKKASIKTILNQFMNAPITYKEFSKLPKEVQETMGSLFNGKVTRGDIAGFALMAKAMEGDINAFKEIADRIEGKSMQRNENMNVSANYTDFLNSKLGFEEVEAEEIDVSPGEDKEV